MRTGKKALVIGGAGFIGSHLVDLLVQEGLEVVVFDNFVRGKRENLPSGGEVTIIEGDIREPQALERVAAGCALVFHQAALWLLECEADPQQAVEVNVAGTFNVLEACRKAAVEKVIFASSSSVYGEASYLPTDERHPFNHHGFYAATKVAGEELLKAFHHKYGLKYVALRYLNVYGPRQDYRSAYISVITNFINRIAAGEPPIIHGDGQQTLDLVYVEDVARANLLAATQPVSGEIFNVASGQETSLRELAGLVIEEMGRAGLTPSYQPVPSELISRRCGSPQKAEQGLGFRVEVPLREGLRRLIAWRERDLERVHG